MISHYIKTAWRAIALTPTYSWINIIGLVLSLAGGIVISRYLHQELSVDHYLPNLHRTTILYNLFENGGKWTTCGKNWNGVPEFPDYLGDPIIEASTQLFPLDNACIEAEGQSHKARVIVGDSLTLKVLPRKLVTGSDRLQEPYDAIVTRKLADRLWPRENPIGKSLGLSGVSSPLTVRGVVESPATKSNFNFDVLVQLDGRFSCIHINAAVCLVKEGCDYRDFNNRHEPFVERYSNNDSFRHNVMMEPLADFYLSNDYPDDGGVYLLHGNVRNIRILCLAAGLLLFVGLFNFLNLYTVVMSARGRNYAIRKAFGAKLHHLFLNIFSENLLLVSIAVGLAWVLVLVATPPIELYLSIEQLPAPLFDLGLSLGIVLLFPLVVSLAAAIAVWRRCRIHSMDNADAAANITLRRYLLLLPQMIVTIALSSVSIYLIGQTHHMLHADLGFQTHDIVTFKLWPEQASGSNYYSNAGESWDSVMAKRDRQSRIFAQAMDAINKIPSVECAAGWDAEHGPTLASKYANRIKMKIAGNPDAQETEAIVQYLSPNQMKLFNIGALRGELPADMQGDGFTYTMIIDKGLAESLGITDAAKERIQTERRLWFSSGEDMSVNPPFEVAAIAGRLRLTPLTGPTPPVAIIIYSRDEEGERAKPIVKYNPAQKKETLAALAKIYKEINGEGAEPGFEFVEEEIARLYAEEIKVTYIYTAFALMAIAISCLGLFGAVVYDLRRRRRELSIRMLHGAHTGDILRLLYHPYAAVILVATAVGVPLSVYGIGTYRRSYSDCIETSPLIFAASVGLIVLISYLTIFVQVKQLYSKPRIAPTQS